MKLVPVDVDKMCANSHWVGPDWGGTGAEGVVSRRSSWDQHGVLPMRCGRARGQEIGAAHSDRRSMSYRRVSCSNPKRGRGDHPTRLN